MVTELSDSDPGWDPGRHRDERKVDGRPLCCRRAKGVLRTSVDKPPVSQVCLSLHSPQQTCIRGMEVGGLIDA